MTRLRMVVSEGNASDGDAREPAYLFVQEEDDGTLTLQRLNENKVPSGERKTVERQDLMQKYQPEPEVFLKEVVPAMQQLSGAINRGELNLADGMLESAEWEFDHALCIDSENVRATFGLGQTYIEMGEPEKANTIFVKLLELAEAFHPRHKHLFNRYGISLRKNRMLGHAVAYYRRALALSKGDENLHFNVARAYYEQEQYADAEAHLEKALSINASFDAAAKFLNVCLKAEGKPMRKRPKKGDGLERDSGTVAPVPEAAPDVPPEAAPDVPPEAAPDVPPEAPPLSEPQAPDKARPASVSELDLPPEGAAAPAPREEPGLEEVFASNADSAFGSDEEWDQEFMAGVDDALLDEAFSGLDGLSFDDASSGRSLLDLLEDEEED